MKKSIAQLILVALPVISVAQALTINVPVDKDTYIASYAPNNNYGSLTSTKLSNYEGSLVAASTLLNALTGYSANDVISAKYKFFVNSYSVHRVYAYAITSDWQENTVTYNNVVNGNPTIDWTLLASVAFGTNYTYYAGWVEMDVTQAVKNWLNGTTPNYGLYLFSADGVDIYIISKEYQQQYGTNLTSYFEITVANVNIPALYQNPYTDTNGNIWSIYSVDNSQMNHAYKSFANYVLMQWFEGMYEDYWLGNPNQYGHPSCRIMNGINVLTSSRSANHYLGILVFQPANSGLYSVNGSVYMQDWDEAVGRNPVVLTIGKFDSGGQWKELYAGQAEHNKNLLILNHSALQFIPITTAEKLVIFGRPAITGGGAAAVFFNTLEIKPVNLSNCAHVQEAGFGLEADFNSDCTVDLNDLKIFIEDWLNL